MVTACPAGPVEARSTRFEVLVLATIHAPWQFRDARIAPPFIAAALAASDPSIVGLETDEEWLAQEKFHDVTFEASHVALPFVKARGIMAYGIEPLDIPAWKHRAEMYARRFDAKVRDQLARGVLPVEEYGSVPIDEMEQAAALFRAQRQTFERVNLVENEEFTARLRDSGSNDLDFGGRANRVIAARCEEVMRDHPGERLVVVVGSGHKASLDLLFERMEGVRVLHLGREVCMPSPAEVEAAWTPEMIVTCLGHNLDGETAYFHPELIDIRWMNDLVRRLAEDPGYVDLARYFGARIAFAGGAFGTALQRLESLAEREAHGEPYPFPMALWRHRYTLSEAIALERARTLIALDRRAEAEPLLEELYRSRQLATETYLAADDGAYHTVSRLLGWKPLTLAREFPRTLLEPLESSKVSDVPD